MELRNLLHTTGAGYLGTRQVNVNKNGEVRHTEAQLLSKCFFAILH
jgi:hypothetical protein